MDHPQGNKMADSHEIRALTGIRGVASVWVVCRHFHEAWTILIPGIAWLNLPFSRGDYAVDLFFILSRFILSYVYSTGNGKFGFAEYGKFLWFRLARIYPVHVATLGIMLVLVIAANVFHISVTGNRPLSNLPFQLTLTQTWPYVPGNPAGEWVGASWSISAEWFAYIFIFPGIAYVLRHKWKTGVLLALAYSFLGLWIFCNMSIITHVPLSNELLKAILEFAVGGFFFGIYSHNGIIVCLSRKYASIMAAYLVLIIIFVNVPWMVLQSLLLPFFPLLLIGLTTEDSWPGWFLSTHFCLWLGRISYALYLGHPVAMRIIKVLLPWERYEHSSLMIRWLVLGANIVLIFSLASLLHYFIEVPARNYLRKVRPWIFLRRFWPNRPLGAGVAE